MNKLKQLNRAQIAKQYLIAFFFLFALATPSLWAQDAGGGFNLAIKHTGIGFGNSKKFNGIRLNYRDYNLQRVNGINATIWTPYGLEDGDSTGDVNGVALGVPLTAARNIRGIALGVGVGAGESMYGLNVGILGAGAGRNVGGIVNIGGLGLGAGYNVSGLLNVGGLGLGAGNHLTGINIGGLAAGAGKKMRGINLGGIAVGAGKEVTGVNLAGVAVGSGGSIRGINVGGLAVGANKNVYGISGSLVAVASGNKTAGINVAGVAVAAGRQVYGLNVAGVAIGAGDEIKGINMAGVAIGARKISGLSAALVVGGKYVNGIQIAPAYMHVIETGTMKGLAVSAFNHIKGTQKGVTIGIFNYARKLKGFQFGLLNYVKDNPLLLRLMPIMNFSFKD